MKKIFSVAALSIVAAVFFSCEKINQDLTRLPIDDINPEA